MGLYQPSKQKKQDLQSNLTNYSWKDPLFSMTDNPTHDKLSSQARLYDKPKQPLQPAHGQYSTHIQNQIKPWGHNIIIINTQIDL
jgi:hypothetical protein